MTSSRDVPDRNERPLRYTSLAVLTTACIWAQVPSVAQQVSPERTANGEKCFVQIPLDRTPINDRSVMCKALEDNLNELCSGQSLWCGLRFSASHPEFQFPAWSPVDISANVGLLENMVRGRAYAQEVRNRKGAPGYEWSQVEQSLKEPQHGPARLTVARVDIMNRGQAEDVYEFWPNTCDVSIGILSSPQILLRRHAEIMTNPEWLAAARRAEMSFEGQFALGAPLGNVFLYQGAAFLFTWSGINPFVEEITGTRSVEGTEYIGTVAVCSFDYRSKRFK